MENIIFHIDVNSAFLSREAVYRLAHRGSTLDLRAVPSAVGGDITLRHGIILAKSIPAKDCGVKTGQTIAEVKKQCPNLIVKRAVFLNQPVDHMSGISKATGLPWEKRTVDYDKVTVL